MLLNNSPIAIGTVVLARNCLNHSMFSGEKGSSIKKGLNSSKLLDHIDRIHGLNAFVYVV